MNRAAFYDAIRAPLGGLSEPAVAGFEIILAEAERRQTALPYLAYILATAWWETAHTMQPVREAFWLSEDWRRKNLRYHPYYGRGYVQLTWEANYRKASDLIGIDFVENPDLAMKPEHSVAILFDGMEKGWFTGKDLDDTIDLVDESDAEDLREFKEARRIVNGTDKKLEIGKLGLVFERALKAADYPWSGAAPARLPPAPTLSAPTPSPAEPERIERREKAAAGDKVVGRVVLEGEILPSEIENVATIKRVQQMLYDKGYVMVGKRDGDIGPSTRDAITIFQRQNGLPINGRMTAELEEQIKRGQPRELAPARVNATMKDIASAPTVKEATIGQIAIGGVGATTIVAGATEMIEGAVGQIQNVQDLSRTASNINSFWSYASTLAWPVLTVVVLILVFLGWRSFRKIKKTQLQQFQSGNHV